MPEIVIQNLHEAVIQIPDNGQSILRNLQEAYIDWMQACGGKGRCTTCRMIVVSGAEALSAASEFEEKQKASGRLQGNERLACQCSTSGNITIRVPEKCKLPHLQYSD